MSTVKRVEFSDYKSFAKFTLSARSKNIIVGPNNSGKSTILDSFRIAFDALRYAKRHTAKLKSHGTDSVCSTYFVPESVIQTDLRACVHNFADGYAKIEIALSNSNTFKIKVQSGSDLECYLVSEKEPQVGAKFLREQFPLDLAIVPTLSPLEQNEELVERETVERNRYSRLASRNFRNFWLHQTEEAFDEFASLVAMGWPGVRIQRPEISRDGSNRFVRMYFREGPNVREVQWAGFGFQVWMQTMTHIQAAGRHSVLVLDEPDVYLHPDLQHRLMNIAADRVGQIFVATHSTEIINQADPGDILIVRPGSRGAKRIQNEKDYPEIYKAIGSSENAQFARLAKTKRVLYFEGNDARLLSKLSKRISGFDFLDSSSLTIMKTEGFSNGSRVSNSSWVFKNFFDFDIPVAALFDRDYRCEAEVQAFLKKENTDSTLCRVLPFKEIENFLLSPAAIKSAIARFRPDLSESVVDERVNELFESISETLKTKALSGLIGCRSEFETRNGRAKELGSISAEVLKEFSLAWSKPQSRLAILPGKEFFSLIVAAVQDEFKVTLTSSRVVDELPVSEIDKDFLTSLQDIRRHLGLEAS